MLVEWLLLLLHEARTYAVSVFRMLFKPSAYAETITIGDRNNFQHSMNFFIGSISVYITVCGLLLLIGAGDVALKNFPGAAGTSIRYVPNEFLAFTKILLGNLVMGLLCFLPISVLTRRRSFKLVDFFHSWVHVSVAGFYIGVVTGLIVALFLPPISDKSYEFVIKSPDLSEFCKIDRDNMICRYVGAAVSLGTFVINKSVDLKLVTSENVGVLPILGMSAIYSYIIAFPLLILVNFIWIMRVQGLIISRTLNISMLTSLCVLVYVAVFMGLLVLAFPQLSPIFFDSDVARETGEVYKLDKRRR